MRTGGTAAGLISFEALDLLGRQMQPFVEERVALRFGPRWRSMLLRGRQLPGDPAWQLLQLTTAWDAFHDALPPSFTEAEKHVVRAHASELLDYRNKIDHHDLSEGPALALRVIDLVARLLDAFGLRAGSAQGELERLRVEAARLMSGGAPAAALAQLRAEYLEGVLAATAYLDLRGIARPDLTDIGRLSFTGVFVPPALVAIDESEMSSGAGLETAVGDDDADVVTPDGLTGVPRAVILGAPGAGKTTVLRYLARTAVLAPDAAARLPIFCPAPRFADALRSDPLLTLRRYASSMLSDEYGEVLAEALAQGDAFLLIDGLDEVADDGLRLRVVDALDEFARANPAVRVLAASRPTGYRSGQLGTSFDTYKIVPFDEERIKTFVTRWHGAVTSSDDPPESHVDDLLARLAEHPRLRELAGTPLLLTMIALAWLTGGQLPAREVDLLRLATDTLLREWPLRRLKRALDEHDMLAVLEPVAHDLIAAGQSVVRRRDLAVRLEERAVAVTGEDRKAAVGSALETIDVVERATGFFALVGRDGAEPLYGFVHRAFAEYLAARYLADRWAAGSLDLRPYLHRRRWLEVLRLVAEQVDGWGEASASRFVGDILSTALPLEPHLGSNRRFAAYLIGVAGLHVRPATLHALATQLVVDFLDPRLDVFRRATAVRLRLLGKDRCGPAYALIASDEPTSPSTAARRVLLRWFLEPTPERLAAVLAAAPDLAATYAPVGGPPAREIAAEIPGVVDDPNLEEEGPVLIDLGPLGLRDGFTIATEEGEAFLAAAGVEVISIADLAERAASRESIERWWALLPPSADDEAAEAEAWLGLCERFPSPSVLNAVEFASVSKWFGVSLAHAAPSHPAGFLTHLETAGVPFGPLAPWLGPLRAIQACPDPTLRERGHRLVVTAVGNAMKVSQYADPQLEDLLAADSRVWFEVFLALSLDRLPPPELQPADGSAPFGSARAQAAASADSWLRLAACDSVITLDTEVGPSGDRVPLPWDAALEPIRPLLADPDPNVRGAAARAVAIAKGSDGAFAVLRPDLLTGIAEHEARDPRVTDLLLYRLASRMPDVPESERGAWADAIGRLVAHLEHRSAETGDYGPLRLEADVLLEAVLIRSLDSDLVPPRLWASRLLRGLDRILAAGPALSRALATPDPDLQRAAARAFQAVDFEDHGWIGDALLDFLPVADVWSAVLFGQALGRCCCLLKSWATRKRARRAIGLTSSDWVTRDCSGRLVGKTCAVPTFVTDRQVRYHGRQRRRERREGIALEADEGHASHAGISLEYLRDGRDGDARRVRERVTVGACADGRQSQASGASIRGDCESRPVRGGQKRFLTMRAVAPGRADSVDDPPAGQTASACHDRGPSRRSAREADAQLLHDRRTSRGVDGTVHAAAAAAEATVRRVADRVSRCPSDIALNHRECRAPY